MSRCFPFPPPGFEPKARPDDVNLIRKEKKEKKKKKHKDKDKKERSKNKENERSEGEHKENKKRKREKDKDKKERKRKKNENQISSEGKQIVGLLENQNGGELVADSKPTDAIHDQGAFPESGKRIIKDGGELGNQMVQKIAVVEKSKVNLDNTELSKMANGQCINVDARRLGNGYGGNCNGENRIKVEGGSCQVDKVEKRRDGNGRNGYDTLFGKGDGCKNEDIKAKERNGYRNVVGEGIGCKNEDQNKNTRALEKEEKDKMAQERKEKIKQGSSDFNFLRSASNPLKDGQGKLMKQKELNGFLPGVRPNNTSRPALPRPVEKGAVLNNHKGSDKISSPQSVINNHGLSNGHLISIKRKAEPCSPPANTVAQVNPIAKNHSAVAQVNPNVKNHSAVAQVNPNVKNHSAVAQVNPNVKNHSAVPQVNPIVKNHSAVPQVNPIVKNHSAVGKVPSTHPLLENGRTSHKPDVKELRKNGSVEGGKCTTSPEPSIALKKLNPHPDLKYLSSILCVPREVELPQCDDQDWLFGCKDKMPKLASSPNQCTKQVWAEAIQLESVDITALPYVIPF